MVSERGSNVAGLGSSLAATRADRSERERGSSELSSRVAERLAEKHRDAGVAKASAETAAATGAVAAGSIKMGGKAAERLTVKEVAPWHGSSAVRMLAQAAESAPTNAKVQSSGLKIGADVDAHAADANADTHTHAHAHAQAPAQAQKHAHAHAHVHSHAQRSSKEAARLAAKHNSAATGARAAVGAATDATGADTVNADAPRVGVELAGGKPTVADADTGADAADTDANVHEPGDHTHSHFHARGGYKRPDEIKHHHHVAASAARAAAWAAEVLGNGGRLGMGGNKAVHHHHHHHPAPHNPLHLPRHHHTSAAAILFVGGAGIALACVLLPLLCWCCVRRCISRGRHGVIGAGPLSPEHMGNDNGFSLEYTGGAASRGGGRVGGRSLISYPNAGQTRRPPSPSATELSLYGAVPFDPPLMPQSCNSGGGGNCGGGGKAIEHASISET